MSKNPVFNIQIRYRGQSQSRELSANDFIVGRATHAQVRLDSGEVSREHLRIERLDGKIWITDLGSTNGTFYQGRRLANRSATVYDGSEVRLGRDNAEGVSLVIQATGVEMELKKAAGAEPQSLLLNSPLSASSPSISPPTPSPSASATRPEPSVSRLSMSGAHVGPHAGSANGSQTSATAGASRADLRLVDRPEASFSNSSSLAVELDGQGGAGVPRGRADQEIDRKRKELLALDDEYRAIEKKLQELRLEAVKAESVIKKSEEKRLELERLERRKGQILEEEEKSSERMKHMDEERHRLENRIDSLLKDQDAAVMKLQDLAEEVRGEEEKQRLEVERLRTETEKLRADKRKIVAELELEQKRMRLEFETQDAEFKLKRSEHQRELEEWTSRRLAAQREYEGIREGSRTLESEKKKMQTDLTHWVNRQHQLERSVRAMEEKERKLRHEVEHLDDRVKQVDQECDELRGKTHEELEQVRAMREAEMEQLIARRVAEAEAAAEISREHFEREMQERKSKAALEYEFSERDFREQLENLKQAENARWNQWRIDQEATVRAHLSYDVEAFARAVSGKVLTALSQGSQDAMISRNDVLQGLTRSLSNALVETESESFGYHPGLKRNVRKFWTQMAVSAVIGGAGIVGVVKLPSFFEKKVEEQKRANQEASNEWVKNVQTGREQRIALKLEKREKFQENYTDNVIYNEGYLELKTDAAVLKEWTLKLNAFILNDLKLDDRVIVGFIAVEQGLMRELAESRKVLNKINFPQIESQMRKSEDEKIQSMWVTLGGRENWLKLRAFEEKFYFDKMKGI